MAKYRIVYLLADLRRVGPTIQTLNIICNSGIPTSEILVLTLFAEPKDSMRELFVQRGICCQSLGLNRGNPVAGFFKLRKFLKQNEIGLVHSFGVKPDLLLYPVSNFQKVRYVLTQRNIPIEDYPPRMNRLVGILIAKLHTFIFKHSKHVIACSKHLQTVMYQRYQCTHVTAIQNGTDTEAFKNFDKSVCREKLGISQGAFVFVSTGLFITRKHNDEIVDAFLKAKFENACLVMLGDGPLLAGMRRKYAEQKSVRFVGKVSNVAEYLSAADCFVSASDSEGLPNAVLESLACGTLVLLSDIPQHKEILDELPNCGELFPLHGVETLLQRMRNVAEGGLHFASVRESLEKSPFTMKKMGALYGEYYRKMESEC